MSRVKKVLVIMLVVLSSVSFVLATDIDMNLVNGNATTNNEVVRNETNTARNEAGENNNATSNTSGNRVTSPSANMVANIESVSNINDTEDNSSLQLTQILNIFLIAVGIILILLAIAILIRLKR